MKNKTVILITLMALVLMATPLMSTVQAKKMEINDREGYTEYYGSLGKANFFVLIPEENWNGMLVVMCRGAGYTEDPRAYLGGLFYDGAVGLVQAGFATAASSYGDTGFDEKFGVIRTHQLTEFVIDKFDVTGKVFLQGVSLGGSIALVLGESYPDVYSGVLDVVGVKDWAMHYNYKETLLDSLDPILLESAQGIYDMIDNYGGTPDERPKKYAKYSATSHTDLAIPIISLVHENDDIVPYAQTTYYHSLVVDTSWHVVVTIDEDTLDPLSPSGDYYGHYDPYVMQAIPIYFEYLVMWAHGFPPALIPDWTPTP